MVVAGVVLEAILSGPAGQGGPEDRERLEKWSELRNGVAHGQSSAVTLSQAKEMVEDVRATLKRETRFGPRLAPPKAPAQSPGQVRGKYTFVPTSAAEFIRRKADELRLEHDEHR